MILPMVLILCIAVIGQEKGTETNSEDLEKELIATVMNHFNAWNAHC